MRAAIYFTPPADHPLTRAAVAWLGRDAFTGEAGAQPGEMGADIDALTREPRRYGFHATVKAPFRLAHGRSLAQLDAELRRFCNATAPIGAMKLGIERLGSFFALTSIESRAAVGGLAAAAVEHFDPFRAPLEPDELARRKDAGLSAVQQRHLDELLSLCL